MTEQIKDVREPMFTAIPHYKVVRMDEHPYHEEGRHYCIVQKMVDEADNFAGWKHISKEYVHSTSAYAAMGRLVQKYIRETHPYLPENER